MTDSEAMREALRDAVDNVGVDRGAVTVDSVVDAVMEAIDANSTTFDEGCKLLGLEKAEPEGTYLDDYSEVWIGHKWDIGKAASGFNLYRNGNWRLEVASGLLALSVIADAEGVSLPFRKEKERQATDREAKAAVLDAVLKTLEEDANGDEYLIELKCEIQSWLHEERQRLNVNPNLVTIERGSVPEWMEEVFGKRKPSHGHLYRLIPDSETKG